MKYRLKKIAALLISACILCTSVNVFGATKLYDSVTREIVASGVTYEHNQRLNAEGWQDIHVLTIDLNSPNIELAPVESSGEIGKKDTVLKMLNDSGAVAGVNSDFFGMAGTHSASFGLNLFIDTGNGTDYDKQKLDVKTAERNYADSVKAKENSIKNAYIGLQNTESERKVLENKLAQAKADYETAKVNYQVGNITKLQLDSAELAITQAEIALEQNTLTHDVNKFMLDNTCLLSGASSASSTQN